MSGTAAANWWAAAPVVAAAQSTPATAPTSTYQTGSTRALQPGEDGYDPDPVKNGKTNLSPEDYAHFTSGSDAPAAGSAAPPPAQVAPTAQPAAAAAAANDTAPAAPAGGSWWASAPLASAPAAAAPNSAPAPDPAALGMAPAPAVQATPTQQAGAPSSAPVAPPQDPAALGMSPAVPQSSAPASAPDAPTAQAAPAAAPANPASLPAQYGSAIVRGGVEGLNDLASVVQYPLKAADYLTGDKINALHYLATPADPQNDLTSLGVPQVTATGPKIVSGAAEAIAPEIATLGLGGALAGGAVPLLARAGRFLSAAPGLQLASAASGGAAQAAAKEDGAGTVGQIAAGIAGSAAPGALAGGLRAVGSAIGDNLARLHTGGQQRLAGQLLLSRASDPAAAAATLKAPLPAPAVAPVSTGELLHDPNLLSLESGIRNQGGQGKDAFTALDAQRAGARATVLDNMQPVDGTEARGQTIRDVLQNTVQPAFKQRTAALYKSAKPGQQQLNVQPVHDAIDDVMSKQFGPGSGGPPGELGDVMNELKAQGPAQPASGFPNFTQQKAPTADGEYLMNVRSRLGNIASMASRTGDNRTASAAGQIRTAIDNVAGSPEWSAAQAARREQGLNLGKDTTGANATGQILRPDKFGVSSMADEKVASRAIADERSARQVLNAGKRAVFLSNNDPAIVSRVEDMKSALRGQFMHELYDKGQTVTGALDAQGNPIANLTAQKFLTYWNKHLPVAKQLFDQGQFKQLTAIAKDFDSEAAAKRLGNTSGSSATNHNQTTAQFLSQVVTGHIPGTHPLATAARKTLGTLAGLGTALGVGHVGEHMGAGEVLPAIVFGHGGGTQKVTHAIQGIGGHGIQHALIEAAANPEVAKQLVSRVSAGALARIAHQGHQTKLQRLAPGLTRVAAQAAVQTLPSERRE